MTSAEHQSTSPEHRMPKWEMLDQYVRERVVSTAVAIEFASAASAHAQVQQLNNHFISDGLIGLPAKVEAEYVSFIHTYLTDDGVREESIIDIDLMKRKEHVGVFKGCVFDSLQLEDPVNILFYNIELETKGGSQFHLRVPVDHSSIKVEYDTGDNWDKEVDGAFAVLETVEDREYQEIVEGLRDAYWNTDQPMTLRLRTLGIHASELLAHPQHVVSRDTVDALGTILLCSLDEELLYEVSGLSVDETRLVSGQPVVKVWNEQELRVFKPVGIRYVTNFEVVKGGEDVVGVALSDTLQPAFVFFDVKARTEVDYPLRFLVSIDEHEYDEVSFHASHSVSVRTSIYGAIGEKTCGELSYEYNQRNKLEP